ncbi:hypothetical protein EQ500_12025, partial [Lactobacillus sp. XV13L]|nr:hypothetical protein [Lactobacillus sp. XV13L]
MDYQAVAKQILQYVGGKDNVAAAAHCATRLRLVLNDQSKVDTKSLDNMSAVKGTFLNDGQFQIVLGPGTVDQVYQKFIKISQIEEMTKSEVKKEAKKRVKNPLLRLVNVLSDIFVPLIPAIVAGGLLMGIINVLSVEGIFGAKSVLEMYP